MKRRTATLLVVVGVFLVLFVACSAALVRQDGHLWHAAITLWEHIARTGNTLHSELADVLRPLTRTTLFASLVVFIFWAEIGALAYVVIWLARAGWHAAYSAARRPTRYVLRTRVRYIVGFKKPMFIGE